METRDFAKLLGDVRADGTRIKGAIEQRLDLIGLEDQDTFLKTITVQAAAVADDKGLITDAVLLYHLAEEHDKVIEIINRALSDAVAIELGGSAMKLQPLKPRTTNDSLQQEPSEPGSSLSLTTVDDPVILARNMIGLYNSNALYYQRIRQINRDSCGVLLRMMEAKMEVEAGKWTTALDVRFVLLLFKFILFDTDKTNCRPSMTCTFFHYALAVPFSTFAVLLRLSPPSPLSFHVMSAI